MTQAFLHGVELTEVTDGLRTISVPSSSVIGLIGTAPGADTDEFPLDTPILIMKPADAVDLTKTLADGDDPGTLPGAIADIFDQVSTPIVIVRVEVDTAEGATLADQLALVVGALATYTGVYALLHAESLLGVKPKILVATGWTHQQPVNGQANPVVVALKAVAAKLRAIDVPDGANDTNTAALAKNTLEKDGRTYPVEPWGVPTSGPATPASARVAGVIAQTDQSKGYWCSPSNQPIQGLVGIGRPITFSLSDPTTDANALNEAGIATIVNVGGGFRLWGNRTGSTDSKWAFLSVRRTADMIYDAVEDAFLWAMDRPFSAQLLKDIEDTGNFFMRGLKAKGAILDGKFQLDPDLNTAATLQAGQAWFDFDFEPPAPLERLSFKASRNADYYDELITAVERATTGA